jgi:hypothetical protein
MGTPFSNARRNFPTDTDGTDTFGWLAAYASDGVTLLSSMEILQLHHLWRNYAHREAPPATRQTFRSP